VALCNLLKAPRLVVGRAKQLTVTCLVFRCVGIQMYNIQVFDLVPWASGNFGLTFGLSLVLHSNFKCFYLNV
jgi:hypothetical protein